jgi:DNA (cytosine-5)-methyltransferase 1
MIKVLNLYAGIGGNRKLWTDVDVTAIEIEPKIAKIYQDFFPDDKVITTDAHQYLLNHFEEFDFIWSSPPCPTHSKIRLTAISAGNASPKYPDMKLYEEVIFLSKFFKGKWCVENVISYYEPLIKPYEVGKHYFWCNFPIYKIKKESRKHAGTIDILQKRKKINLDGYTNLNLNKSLLLRNCVEPELGLHIFECAFKQKQKTLIEAD